MFKIGVFAIISDPNDKILLCHRCDIDWWNLPGGVLENGEAPWQGVIREVQEEVKLDVSVERLAGIYYKLKENEIVFSFICKTIGGKPGLTDEADRIEYFSLENLPINTLKLQVERIRDAVENPNDVTLKIQLQQEIKKT